MSNLLPDCMYDDNQPTLIRPCNPTPNHTLHLSNLDDQNFLRFSIKYLYVYKKAIDSNTLKESLSRVLVHYYPLAGRLRKSRHNDNDGKLEVECNGEGAIFAVAKMDISTDEFLKFAVKPNRSMRKLLYTDGWTFLDAPPLIIQVTNLSCGGMILCTSINHCLCDGIGTSQFLHAWAYMTDQSNSCQVPIPPIHSRHVLTPRHRPPQLSLSLPALISNPQPHQNGAVYNFLNNHSHSLVPASITFLPSHILHLKRLCSPSLKCTAFEVLASHTWRCWAKSLSLPPSLGVKLLFSVNVRDRLSSVVLPQGYYGNGFVLACAEAKVKELVGGLNLHGGVKLVQRAKSTAISDEYVMSMVDLLEDKTMRTDQTAGFVISQWSKLGLQEVDFGEGKPMHMGPLTSNIYCLFLPVVGDSDAVRVLVSLPETVVQKFELYMTEVFGVGEYEGNMYGSMENLKMVYV